MRIQAPYSIPQHLPFAVPVQEKTMALHTHCSIETERAVVSMMATHSEPLKDMHSGS